MHKALLTPTANQSTPAPMRSLADFTAYGGKTTLRSELTLAALVRELTTNYGDELEAARKCGVSLMFVNQWRKDDTKVDEALIEAARVGTQGLYSAAVQRGVHGVQEGIYYKGAWIADKTVYSDSLLGKLMEAKLPEFKKGADASAPTINVNVANIMPRAANYQEWLAMKQQTLAGPTEAPLEVAVTDVTEEAEVSDVAKAAAFFMAEPQRNPFEGVEL